MKLRANIKTNLCNKVANILRKKILEGDLLPGEHLSVGVIAEDIGLSSGPVRDALRILENEGFVSTPPNGRTIVVGFNEQDIEDYHEVRFYLELEAMKRIIKNADNDSTYDEWLKEMEKYINMMKKYLDMNNQEYINKYDYLFHESIMNKSENRIIIRIWNSMSGTRKSIMEINEYHCAHNNKINSEKFFRYHNGIYLGFKNKDLSMLRKSIMDHLEWGTKIYKSVINNKIKKTNTFENDILEKI